MLRKIQAVLMILGFGIVSYLEFTKGFYLMGSLAAIIVLLECVSLTGVLDGETTINLSVKRDKGENK
ncbi:hypothetical protein [Bacillus cereus]|uniref:hypothetical protein n=1 Tax=Bacillus cereus TaxID=1396 RepID=UPI00240623E3|nr:hypothetical protein [Bacillus cereus]MDF9638830.1 hypothetical protein [Bacillus cereus]